MSTSLVHHDPGPAEAVALNESSLARAFACFTEAAGSLERSYAQLQAEVAGLRHEREAANRDLARSVEENRRMRQHLDRIVEGLPCGVLVMSQGLVALANPEAQRLLGVSASSALPEWMSSLVDHIPCDSSELECQAGGDLRWIAIRRAQLNAKDGGSSIFILQDISARKRLEQAQAHLRRRHELAEMSAVLAHEIRNPLGSLELFAGLLAESVLSGECRQWVEHVQAGLRTLGATVNNVLHFHSEPRAEMASTDLGQLLRSLHDFLRPLAAQARVRLELADRLDGVLAAADRHRLEQVLFNLALNGFRFMPGGGVLKLLGTTVQRDGAGYARIEVADTGPGIAPENCARIFDPGFTTRSGSPGLGLAVCQTIMQQHGGTIAVSSRPGHGTVFVLELPLSGATP